MPEGIETRHSRNCSALNGKRCNCQPSYRATVWDSKTKKLLKRTFANLAEAKQWRRDALTAVEMGARATGGSQSFSAAADALIAGMEQGLIRNRSGEVYKPSVIRSYAESIRLYIDPEIGPKPLRDITRMDLQRVVGKLLEAGKSASTIRNAINPVRVVFRRALRDGEILIDPTNSIELPAVRGKRDRVAGPSEAAALIAALPETDKAIWATALYAGLRRGELAALEWQDVDFQKGVINVRRSWDGKCRMFVDTKSRAGERAVPILPTLRTILISHRLCSGRSEGLCFSRSGSKPLSASALAVRAREAWRAAGLAPIGLHECRHSFASLAIAAGLNVKEVSTFLGHARVGITLDRYGHLFPGSEAEAAARMEAFLGRIDSAGNP